MPNYQFNIFIPTYIEVHIVTILHPDEGSMGKYSPEYQLSSRVATSQLKEPRVMKVDTRGVILKDS